MVVSHGGHEAWLCATEHSRAAPIRSLAAPAALCLFQHTRPFPPNCSLRQLTPVLCRDPLCFCRTMWLPHCRPTSGAAAWPPPTSSATHPTASRSWWRSSARCGALCPCPRAATGSSTSSGSQMCVPAQMSLATEPAQPRGIWMPVYSCLLHVLQSIDMYSLTLTRRHTSRQQEGSYWCS